MAAESPWTPERIGELKQLWAAGYSCSQIAARLGRPFLTRNAVIGKVSRLGLPRRETGRRFEGRSKKRRKPAPPPPRKPISAAAEAINAMKRDGMPTPTLAETDIARVSFADLESHHCKFPCWQDVVPLPHELAFCGSKRLPNLPYCAVHVARTFQLPQARRPELRLVAGKELVTA